MLQSDEQNMHWFLVKFEWVLIIREGGGPVNIIDSFYGGVRTWHNIYDECELPLAVLQPLCVI